MREGIQMKWIYYVNRLRTYWLTLMAILFPTFVQGNTQPTVNIDDYTFMPHNPTVLAKEGTLLLSDSPEYVDKNGILAAGTLEGDSRIYFYHVNESDQPKKIVLLLENRYTKDAQVQVKRTIAGVSHVDYFINGGDLSHKEITTSLESLDRWKQLGIVPSFTTNVENKKGMKKGKKKRENVKEKEKGLTSDEILQKDSLSLKPHKVSLLGRGGDNDQYFHVGPGERKQLFLELEDMKVKKDELFSGIVDFHTTAPLFASVMMQPLYVDSKKASYNADILPIDDVELRGTFKGLRRLLEVKRPFHTDGDAAAIELANNREDAYIDGVDELSNHMAVKNKGNYGVSNTLILHTVGTDSFAMYFNPLGGAYKGSIKITDSYGYSKVYDLPKRGEYTIGHGTIYDTQYMDTFESNQDFIIEYMSPGASNLPVRLLLIPLKKLNMRNESSI